MPRLKRSEQEQFNKTLAARIKYGMDRYDVSYERMAACMGVSRSTLFSRLKSPQNFTLGELSAAAKTIHTTTTALLTEAGGEA